MTLPSEPLKLEIGGTYKQEPYQMFSGSAEAESHVYDLYRGKSSKLWLVSTNVGRADNIYVSGGPTSDGFGGRVLEFPLAKGLGSISLKGPWHSNSGALLADTGVDVTEEHLTWGVIGEGREFEGSRTIITGLLYFDDKPKLGIYKRIEKLAQLKANKLNHPLVFHMESKGGSNSCIVSPNQPVSP